MAAADQRLEANAARRRGGSSRSAHPGRTMRAVGVVLMASAFAFGGFGLFAHQGARANAQSAASTLQQRMPAQATADYRVNENVTMPVSEVEGASFVGVVNVESASLTTGVGADANAVSHGMYRQSGSAYTHDLVVCDWSDDLSAVRPGDSLELTDMGGNAFSYKALRVTSAAKDDAATVADGAGSAWDLTLVTSTTDPSTRQVVRFKLQA